MNLPVDHSELFPWIQTLLSKKRKRKKERKRKREGEKERKKERKKKEAKIAFNLKGII